MLDIVGVPNFIFALGESPALLSLLASTERCELNQIPSGVTPLYENAFYKLFLSPLDFMSYPKSSKCAAVSEISFDSFECLVGCDFWSSLIVLITFQPFFSNSFKDSSLLFLAFLATKVS